MCENLDSVDLPDSLEIIGQNSFLGCISLEIIEFPESLKIIGDGAFCGCKKLENVKLPDSLKSIGGASFVHCKIKSIYIPESVESIGENCFTVSSNDPDAVFVEEIRGAKGSYAERYAKENGITFVEETK